MVFLEKSEKVITFEINNNSGTACLICLCFGLVLLFGSLSFFHGQKIAHAFLFFILGVISSSPFFVSIFWPTKRLVGFDKDKGKIGYKEIVFGKLRHNEVHDISKVTSIHLDEASNIVIVFKGSHQFIVPPEHSLIIGYSGGARYRGQNRKLGKELAEFLNVPYKPGKDSFFSLPKGI